MHGVLQEILVLIVGIGLGLHRCLARSIGYSSYFRILLHLYLDVGVM